VTRFAPERLAEILAQLGPSGDCWVAYSGGLDSAALLSATAAAREQLPGRLRAIHIDHGLHPDSRRWAQHCRSHCDLLGVPLVIRCLNLRPIPGESLEAMAREARYRALETLLGPGDLLLTAHTQDDQAETLLLALLRGSGVHGLAAMPFVAKLGHGRLVRPLLEVSRAALEQYASRLGLAWVDDPSNEALRMDRNFLRHRVVPLLRSRWPGVSATLARSAAHCAEAAHLTDALAADLLDGCAGSRPGTLSIPRLADMDRTRRKAVLRLWLRRRGFLLPDTRHLARILDEVLPAGPDADPLVAWSGCEVRRYRSDLFALRPLPPSLDAVSIPWDPRGASIVLDLPQGLGRLRWRVPADLPEPKPSSAAILTIRFGEPGLRCRTRSSGHRRPLKKLFQESGIPSWLRPYVPLVFSDETLIAVAGMCGCVGSVSESPAVEAPRWIGHPWEGLGLFQG
jgi:tRNA(Ile)-lysidine synthase